MHFGKKTLKTIMRQFSGTLLCATAALGAATPAMALDFAFSGGVSHSESYTGPNNSGCFTLQSSVPLNALSIITEGTGETVGASAYLNNAPSPGFPLTISSLQNCGFLDVEILSNNGADSASLAADDYIGVKWKARETAGGRFMIMSMHF